MAISPTRQTVYLRARPQTAHPPYGLFGDPHRGTHTWWAVDSRAILGFATIIGALGAMFSLLAR